MRLIIFVIGMYRSAWWVTPEFSLYRWNRPIIFRYHVIMLIILIIIFIFQTIFYTLILIKNYDYIAKTGTYTLSSSNLNGSNPKSVCGLA